MIAGGEGKIDPGAALSFECEDNGASGSTFLTGSCKSAFIEFKMPDCWNGGNRTFDDSHVKYSSEDEDTCPPGQWK